MDFKNRHMAPKSTFFLKALYVISWIIFIGVCIEAGGFIVNTVLRLTNPSISDKLWSQVDLNDLYAHSESDFVTVTILMIIVAVLKAIMFYLIIKVFHEKHLDVSQPFNETMRRFLVNLAYLALGIGLFSFWGAKYTEGLTAQGVKIPDLRYLRLAGADVWFFMGITLLVIAQMFRKGIELQNENDLTV